MSKNLIRIQAISGLLFSFFLILHLVTTLSALGGPSLYDSTLSFMGNIYRPNLIIETLLIGGPLLVHLYCAFLSLWKGLKKKRTLPMYLRIHQYSGIFLLLVIFGHVFFTRIVFAIGLPAEGQADFSYLAFSMINWGWFFGPYYLFLALSGLFHMSFGMIIALKSLFPSLIPKDKLISVVFKTNLVFGLILSCAVGSIYLKSKDANKSRYGNFLKIYKKYVPWMKPKNLN